MILLFEKLLIEHNVAFYLQMACKHVYWPCSHAWTEGNYLRWMLTSYGCLHGVCGKCGDFSYTSEGGNIGNIR